MTSILLPDTTITTANCLTCSKYIQCRIPDKKYNHACSSYSPIESVTGDMTFVKHDVDNPLGTTAPGNPLDVMLSVSVRREKRTKDGIEEVVDKSLGLSDDDFENEIANLTDEKKAQARDRRGDKKSRFDIAAIMKAAAAGSSSLVPKDLKVSDSDFPEAKNFYNFTTGEDFLQVKPYMMQLVMGTIVCADYCPLCSDMDWLLEGRRVDDTYTTFENHVCLLEYGKCPACGEDRASLYKKNYLNVYQGADIVAGQRGGKSAWIGMMGAYLSHKLIKLQKPTDVYGLLPNQTLHGTLVALTYSQARDTLWQPLYEYLQTSPWFSAYHERLEEYADKYGEQFFKLKDSFVYYRHRSFLVYASAPHSKVLRGRTRFLGSVDELGLFDHSADSARVRTNGTEVAISLERSLRTIRSAHSRLLAQGFSDVPTAMFLNVSSPFSQFDTIMTRYRNAVTSRKVFGLLLSTWEMNPTITKEDLSEEFANDPIAAWRDYGAQPALATNPFIGNYFDVQRSYSVSRHNGVVVFYKTGRRVDGSIYRYVDIDWSRKVTKPSVLAIDCGYCLSGDSMLFSPDTGIVRIDSLCAPSTDTKNPKYDSRFEAVTFNTVGFGGKSRIADMWIHNGIKTLYKITLANGSSQSCTVDHQHFTVGNNMDLIWRTTNRLNKKSYLVMNGTDLMATRVGKLELPKLGKGILMTPELAYLIGSLINRGVYVKASGMITMTAIPEALAVVIERAFINIFGVKPHRFVTRFGKRFGKNNDQCDLSVNSREEKLLDKLQYLGLSISETRTELRNQTLFVFDQALPWCIYQADKESQAAYMATCLDQKVCKESEGKVRYIMARGATYTSQIQILLNYNGISCEVYSNLIKFPSLQDSLAFLAWIYPHLQDKTIKLRLDRILPKFDPNKISGVPTSLLSKCIGHRKVDSNKFRGDDGEVIATDVDYDGVYLRKLLGSQVRPDLLTSDNLSPEEAAFVRDFLRIAPSMAANLQVLFDTKSVVSRMESRVLHRVDKVYDLRISDVDVDDVYKQPAFLSNGIVTHNSNNSFALVSAYMVRDRIVVDSLVEVAPRPGEPVNHTKIFENVVIPLLERKNVVYVSADRWQSILLLSNIEAMYGIQAKQYSLKYRDFFDTKSMLEQGNLLLPKPVMEFDKLISVGPSEYPGPFMCKPADHLVFQTLTVRDTGKQVVKGDGNLNDDLFRALCLAVRELCDPKKADLFSGQREEEKKNSIKAGVMRRGVGNAKAGSAEAVFNTRSKSGVAIGSRPRSRR